MKYEGKYADNAKIADLSGCTGLSAGGAGSDITSAVKVGPDNRQYVTGQL